MELMKEEVNKANGLDHAAWVLARHTKEQMVFMEKYPGIADAVTRRIIENNKNAANAIGMRATYDNYVATLIKK